MTDHFLGRKILTLNVWSINLSSKMFKIMNECSKKSMILGDFKYESYFFVYIHMNPRFTSITLAEFYFLIKILE